MPGLWEDLLQLIFPINCRVCGDVAPEYVCSRCIRDFSPIEPPLCRACGIPLPSSDGEEKIFCPDCEFERPPFEICRSVYHYGGKLQEALKILKFQYRKEMAESLFAPAAAYFHYNRHIYPVDCIVPAPSNSEFLEKRKFNPSLIFSGMIRHDIGLPIFDCLKPIRPVRPQYELGWKERFENLQGAFVIDDKIDMRGRKVLLTDDIITSGATVFECARTLRQAGVSEVYVLTLSRSFSKPAPAPVSESEFDL